MFDADIEDLLRRYQTTAEDRSAANAQGLLAAGLAMLGGQKGREWEAISRGGLLGLNARSNYLQDVEQRNRGQIGDMMKLAQYRQGQQQFAQQQAEWQAKQQEMARARALQERKDAAIAANTQSMRLPGPPTEQGVYPPEFQQFNRQGYAQALESIDPMAGLQYSNAIQKPALELPYDKPKPEHYTPESVAAFAQTRNPAVLVPVAKPDASPIGKINPSDFDPASVAQFFAGGGKDYSVLKPIDKRPVTTVKVNNVAETEENKAIGKSRGELFSKLTAGAQHAQSRITALSTIESLMGDIETSAATPFGNKAAAYAKALGITIDPNLPRKEAAQAFMNQLALDSRSTAEGGGMPGSMTDKDREFLIGINPNMGQTKSGRKILIEVQKRLAKRNQQMAGWAAEYRAKNGSFDEGFQDFARLKAEKYPLFDDLFAGSPSPSSPGAPLRFDRYGNPM